MIRIYVIILLHLVLRRRTRRPCPRFRSNFVNLVWQCELICFSARSGVLPSLKSRMSARVVLPCDDNEEWKEIQTFLLVLSQSSSPEDLRVFAGVVSKSLGEFQRLNRIKMLNYLHRYLKDYCTAKDRDRFFKVTLPCICRLASQLPSLTPSEGIPFGRSQEGSYVRGTVSV